MTFEEGTCAAWLDDLLKTHVTKVPSTGYSSVDHTRPGNKSDRIDARELADLLRSGLLSGRVSRSERRAGFDRVGPGRDIRISSES